MKKYEFSKFAVANTVHIRAKGAFEYVFLYVFRGDAGSGQLGLCQKLKIKQKTNKTTGLPAFGYQGPTPGSLAGLPIETCRITLRLPLPQVIENLWQRLSSLFCEVWESYQPAQIVDIILGYSMIQ